MPNVRRTYGPGTATEEGYAGLPESLRAWVRAISEAGSYEHGYLEGSLGIAKKGRGRTIPKETEGYFTVPGTSYQIHVYRSGARKGLKRLFAVCPACGREVEAGHVAAHVAAHVPRAQRGPFNPLPRFRKNARVVLPSGRSGTVTYVSLYRPEWAYPLEERAAHRSPARFRYAVRPDDAQQVLREGAWGGTEEERVYADEAELRRAPGGKRAGGTRRKAGVGKLAAEVNALLK